MLFLTLRLNKMVLKLISLVSFCHFNVTTSKLIYCMRLSAEVHVTFLLDRAALDYLVCEIIDFLIV